MTDTLKIFISHSNKYQYICDHFESLLRSLGFEPVVVEKMPDFGRSWSPNEKVRYFMDRCDAVLVLGTPDDEVGGKFQSSQNVIHEIGLAQALSKNVIYLKEKTTDFPSNINPVYISFTLDHPEAVHTKLISELRSLRSRRVRRKRKGTKAVTSTELIFKAAEDAGVPKETARTVVKSILESITGALASGDKVTLVGFGTFLPAQRKARTGRNPQTGGVLRIPAKTVPKFRPGKKLKDAVA